MPKLPDSSNDRPLPAVGPNLGLPMQVTGPAMTALAPPAAALQVAPATGVPEGDVSDQALVVRRERQAAQRAAEMRRSAQAAFSTDPDAHARALKLAQRKGIGFAAASAALQGDPNAAAMDELQLRRLAKRLPTLSRWLADPHNFAIARDDIGPLEEIEGALADARDEQSYLEALVAAGGAGLDGLDASAGHLAATFGLLSLEDAAQRVAAANQRSGKVRDERPLWAQRYFAGIEDASGLGVVSEALSSLGGLSLLVTENLANALPSVVGGATGLAAGAKAGGTLGALAGPGAAGGAAVGGGIGMVSGAFAGGVAVEVGAWVNEALAKRGVNITDAEEILAAYQDAQLMGTIRAEAVRKGVTTAGIDALSTLVGGRFLAATRGAGVVKRAAAGAAELGVQSGSESLGEGLGQLAATGEVDVEGALLEGVAALGQSTGEIMLGSVWRAGGRPAVERVAKAVQTQKDATALSAVADAWLRSKPAKRAAPRVTEFVKAAAARRGLETVTISVDAWDAYWASQRRSPAEQATLVFADDGVTYHEAQASGELVLPTAKLIEQFADGKHLDGLLPSIRTRPEGPTVAEATSAIDEVQRQVAEAERQATELFQEERAADESLVTLEQDLAQAQAGVLEAPQLQDLQARRAALLERISADARQLATGEATDPSVTEPTVPERSSPVARVLGVVQRAMEFGRGSQTPEEREAVPTDLATLLNLSPERLAEAADNLEDAVAAVDLDGQDRIGGVTAGLRALGVELGGEDIAAAIATARARVPTLSGALRELADVRRAELGHGAARQASDQAQRLVDEARAARRDRAARLEAANATAAGELQKRVTEELVSAGRPRREAKQLASLHTRMLATVAARHGVHVTTLEQRFPLRFTREGAVIDQRRDAVAAARRDAISALLTGRAPTPADAPAAAPASPPPAVPPASPPATPQQPTAPATAGPIAAAPLPDPPAALTTAADPPVALPASGRPAAAGRATKIFTVGRTYEAVYELRDLDDLIPSHAVTARGGGLSYAADSRYPAGLQPRDYASQVPEQTKVEKFALELGEKAELFLGDSPTPTDGPPIVTPDGRVINGNGRTIALKVAALVGKFSFYQARLRERLDRFGIDPATAAGMKAPVLVRVVQLDAASTEAHRFAREGNEALTQAQGLADRMASLKGIIPDSVLTLDVPEDSTLPEFLAGDSAPARAALDAIWAALPENLRPAFFSEPGLLSAEGKQAISELVLSAVLPADVVDGQRPQVRNMLMKAVPQLAAMRREVLPAINLADDLHAALRFGRETLLNWTQALGQQMLGAPDPLSSLPEAQQTLVRFLVANLRRDTALRGLLTEYVTYARGSQMLGQAHTDISTALGAAMKATTEKTKAVDPSKVELFQGMAENANANAEPFRGPSVQVDGSGEVVYDYGDGESHSLLANTDVGAAQSVVASHMGSALGSARDADRSRRDQGDRGRVADGGSKLPLLVRADSASQDSDERRHALPGDVAPGARDAELRGLLAGLPGRIEPSERISNLIDGVARGDLLAVAPLRGAEVRSARDAATLLAAFRSPFVERLTWLIVGADGIVKRNGLWSIGMIDGSLIPQPEELEALLQATGVQADDTMYWAHNHPSGDPTPSPADFDAYAYLEQSLAQRGVVFRGLVLNGHRYAAIAGGASTFGEYEGGPEFARDKSVMFIHGPDDVARFTKHLSIASTTHLLVHTTTRGAVQGVEAFDQQPSREQTIASRDAVGGARSVLVGPAGVVDFAADLDGRVQDIVAVDHSTGTVQSGVATGKFTPRPIDEVGGLSSVNIVRELQQRGDKDERGSIKFDPNLRGQPVRHFTMTFFRGADRSTFFHELGHYYLEVLGELAAEPTAPQGIREDHAAVLKWFGAESAADITREMHEQWARGFEAYIFEGKAPTPALRRVFATFRRWLVAVYRDIAGLNVELTDDVRAVMDRLVASDAEIEAGQAAAGGAAVFESAAEAGMSEDEFRLYRGAVDAAGDAAREEVGREVLRSQRRAELDAARERLDEIRAEVLADVLQEPEQVALTVLRDATLPDGGPLPEGVLPVKLDRAALSVEYGPSAPIITQLEALGVVTRTGGLVPGVAAEMLGFGSGDALVKGLLGAEDRRTRQVEDIARRRLRDERPELAGVRLARRARDVSATDERIKVTLAELKALRARARLLALQGRADRAEAGLRGVTADLGRERRRRQDAELTAAATGAAREMEADLRRGAMDSIAKHEAARIAARRILERLPVSGIHPLIYLSAARRARHEVADRVRVGAYQQAARASERELLNLELYRLARTMADEIGRIQRYTARLNSNARQAVLVHAGMGTAGIANAILDRFGLLASRHRGTLPTGKMLDAYVAWNKELDEASLMADVSPSASPIGERTPWRELTFQQFEDVRDALLSIENMARGVNDVRIGNEKAVLSEIVGGVVRQLESSGTYRSRVAGEPNLRERATDLYDGIAAAHRKIASLAREMDGGIDNGPAWNAIVRPLNEAGAREASLAARINKAVLELYRKHLTKEDRRALDRRIDIGGMQLSHADRLIVMCNLGTAENEDRLHQDPAHNFSPEVLEQIRAMGTERDWLLVQGILDLLEQFWPEIKAKQERVFGVAPRKVEARKLNVTTADGKVLELRGGYFPLKYDDERAFAQQLGDQAKAVMRGAFAAGTTRRGFTQDRLANVSRRMRISQGVIYQHLTEVIHDLSHHEALLTVNRVLRDKNVERAMVDFHGRHVRRQFLAAVQDIAAGYFGAQDTVERSLEHVRVGAVVSALGYNVVTSAINITGLMQSFVRVGPVHVARAMGRFLRSPREMRQMIDWVRAKSEVMRTRGVTLQRELAEARSAIRQRDGVFSRIDDASFWFLEVTQTVVDMPTWLGAYEKAVANGLPDADAVAVADQAVLDSRGGGQVKDLASVQRGGPYRKLWTTLYGYANTTINLSAERTTRAAFRSPQTFGRWLVDMLMLWSVPAVLSLVLREALRGDLDDEDLVEHLAREQISYLLGSVVLARELSGAVQGFYGYEGPAGARFFADAGRLVREIGQGDLDDGLAKAAVRPLGTLLHLPTTQALRTWEALSAMSRGKNVPPTAVLFGLPRR